MSAGEWLACQEPDRLFIGSSNLACFSKPWLTHSHSLSPVIRFDFAQDVISLRSVAAAVGSMCPGGEGLADGVSIIIIMWLFDEQKQVFVGARRPIPNWLRQGIRLAQIRSLRKIQPSSCSAKATRQGIPMRLFAGKPVQRRGRIIS